MPMRRNKQMVPAQEIVDELGLKFETLAEIKGAARLPGKNRGKRQAGPTGGYDTGESCEGAARLPDRVGAGASRALRGSLGRARFS